MTGFDGMHIGRSFGDLHPIEDECPCPQEPCGLVSKDKIDPSCTQHVGTKTIRQAHLESECPAKG